MEVVILVLHVILALSIIGVILLQPPESSSLGGLGGSNQMASFSGRSQGNILTRATAILAGLFICTSLILAILAGHKPKQESILDMAGPSATAIPAQPTEPVDAPQVPAAEKAPEPAPSVPLAK